MQSEVFHEFAQPLQETGFFGNIVFGNNFSRCLFYVLHHRYMFRPLLAILRWNMQLTVGSYYTYNGSVVLCALYTAK
jgi:hypothetical protein